MASPVKSPKQKVTSKNACVFCGEASNDEDTFGKLLSKANLSAHYFCMLFASGLSQKGKSEKQGILGFLASDITKEVKRAARLRCCYCKKQGATIGCVMKNCKKSFHLGCGRRNGTLHQFFDTFCSYCPTHKPQQEGVACDDQSRTCSICMVAVSPPTLVTDALQAPCCKRDWYHKDCIQRYANSAGLHFFKCPLCNNKDEFQHTMLTFGIYIPDQDASWETEPNAYQELLERYRHCDAKLCKCPEGRKCDKDGTKWEIILCDYCGSTGTHVACNHLLKLRKLDVCAECYAVEQKVKLEKKVMSPGKRKSLEMPLLDPAFSPDGQKEAGSSYPGPSNKMRKKGIPIPMLTSPEYSCPVLSPQEKINLTYRSGLQGKEKGKRMSLAKAEMKAANGKRVKVRCETVSSCTWSSDDELSLAETINKGKKLGDNSDRSADTMISPKSGKTGVSGVKKTMKNRKSVENDSSQTSITRWFKAQPEHPVDSNSKTLSSSSSQTSIIKWFKNRSTALDNIGTQPISQPVAEPSPKKLFERPKTAEWQGKQLIIKSPRVLLRKYTRLGKLKPQNLAIDMNDRKGTSTACDFLDIIDTDVRLTRNMIQTDKVYKRISLSGVRDFRERIEKTSDLKHSPSKTSVKIKQEMSLKKTDLKEKVQDGSEHSPVKEKVSTEVEAQTDINKPQSRIQKDKRKCDLVDIIDADKRLARKSKTEGKASGYEDSPKSVKTDRKLVSMEAIEEDIKSSSECGELNNNSDNTSRNQPKSAILKLKEMLNTRVENNRKKDETCVKLAETMSPLKTKEKEKVNAELNDGEHTPTRQIHTPFDFSIDDTAQLVSGSVSNASTYSKNSALKKMAHLEASPSRHNTKPNGNSNNKLLMVDSPRRSSPRTRSRSPVKPWSGSGPTADKGVARLAEVRPQSPLTKVKGLSASQSPRSSPRLKSKSRFTDMLNVITLLSKQSEIVGSDEEPTTSPGLLKRTISCQTKVESSKRKLDVLAVDGDVDASASKRSLLMENADSGKPVVFTKLTARSSPRNIADAEMDKSVSPTACKSLQYSDEPDPSVEQKKNETLSLLKAYKPCESLLKTKINTTDKHSNSDKVLRLRERNSLPENDPKPKEPENSIVWSLQGTRQITPVKNVPNSEKVEDVVVPKSKPSVQSLDTTFAVPTQENTNPNTNLTENARRNSLPLKKRKCSKFDAQANKDIRDFLGKSHSLFFNGPKGLSRSNSECSEISSSSDMCQTALKLSPSYVTKFRRSHSRTDTPEISKSVVQNLSNFSGDESSAKSDIKSDIKLKDENSPSSLSDKVVMSDYYSAKTISKKRRSFDSEGSLNSDDSDIMIISPIVEAIVIE